MALTTAPNPQGGKRAALGVKHLRSDKWWVEPAITAGVLVAFVIKFAIAIFAFSGNLLCL